LDHNEEKARQMRQLTQQAIQAALDSRWDDAVQLNRDLLKIVHPSPETMNRLGKAYSELGQYSEARKSYGESLQLDPENVIARKNLDRLSMINDDAVVEGGPTGRIDPRLFIEEVGKTGVTQLVNLAPAPIRARLTAGDQVYLKIDGHTLYVRDARGETIGQLEAALANRLIKFMQGGNQYAAAITDLSDREVRIIIRETFQHPSQIGKVSFPPLGPGSLPRLDPRLSRDRDEDADDDDDDDLEDEPEEETDEEEEADSTADDNERESGE
jgi:tetratricopeptide (TPR) repeat protein